MSFLGGMFSPAQNIPLPGLVQQPNTGGFQADPSQINPTQTALLGGIGGLSQYNTAAQGLPQAWNIGQGMINDPNAAGYVGGAGTAAGLGTSAATNAYGIGGGMYDVGSGLYGQGSNLFGLGNQIANTAFDPQHALYAQQQQLMQDQARANASAAGLGTSGVGVAATDWANNNFNINWQNQQLQRQIAGGQAASGLYGQGAGIQQTGAGIQNMGAGLQAGAAPLFMQSAAYPWMAGQQVGQANLGTLGTLGQMGIQAAQIPGQQIAGWQNALQGMGALQNQSFNQNQQQFMDAYNQNQAMFHNQMALQQQQYQQQASTMGGLGKIFGGIGGAALGGMAGGPMGMMAGGMLGANIFGGGGSGGSSMPTGWGGNPWAGMPTNWNNFSNPFASTSVGQAQPGSYGYMG